MTDLSARFATRLGRFDLDAAVEAPANAVTGLFGPSGSGKTTILRGVAGLERMPAGTVRIGGTVWQDEATGRFTLPERRGVGYVSQHADLFPHLTVRANLQYGYRRVPAEGRGVAWDDVVGWLELTSLLGRTVPHLSGGERQRVALARALLASPTLLLLDEPVSALDEPGRREVLHHLETVLSRLEVPVIYVSHSLAEVTRLADRLIWLVEGRVVESGPVTRVLNRLDFAGWRGEEMGTVLDGRIASHDAEFDLTSVATPLGTLIIARRPEVVDARVRIQILARDVSIGLQSEERSSILNELPLEILGLDEAPPAGCVVRLGAGTDREADVLTARITRKSQAQLGLAVGMRVFARVKSVAVMD